MISLLLWGYLEVVVGISVGNTRSNGFTNGDLFLFPVWLSGSQEGHGSLLFPAAVCGAWSREAGDVVSVLGGRCPAQSPGLRGGGRAEGTGSGLRCKGRRM